MLDLYYGEFTVNPIPLEMSLNWCSHGCAYCFANLNTPNREANIAEIMSLISNAHKRRSAAAMLLRERYPVLISNRTDAFAHSNYKQALPIMRVLADMDIPIAIQTKGGRGIDEALEFMLPSCWYISISFEDDDMREVVEPGAPSLSERYSLIEKLVSLGHVVYLGLNPLVPEWAPNPETILQRAKSLGVFGVWIELLHLNKNQIAAMSERERQAVGEDVIARAKGPLASDEDALRKRAFDCARDIGLETFCLRQTTPSLYWEPYKRIYNRLFSTHQDFVNWCHANKQAGEAVTFDEYISVMLQGMPTGEHRIESYIRVPNRALFLTERIPSVMSYETLLRYAWNEPRLWFSPARFGNFAYAAVFERGEPVCLTDERDNAYMIWDPGGNYDCTYIETE